MKVAYISVPAVIDDINGCHISQHRPMTLVSFYLIALNADAV